MKKYVNTRVLLLFCLCALLLAGAAVTYAWYRPIKLNFAPAKVDGSIRASYFQSGDGSQAQPFEIAKPEQFYNLAWLQYLGKFNEADENRAIPTTYFYLSADIDMTGYVLPPVGTEKYPFVGNFDGKGRTVTGLEIAAPTDLPIEGEYEKPQIVGAFGVVGTMGDTKDSITIDGENYTYSSAANEVKNVTFKGLTVETQTTNALIGLAAGYVNGTLTNVGIQLDNTLMSNLVIKLNTSPLNAISANLSDHSLVGYTKDVETDTSNTVKHYQPTAAQTENLSVKENAGAEGADRGALNVQSLYSRVGDAYQGDNPCLYSGGALGSATLYKKTYSVGSINNIYYSLYGTSHHNNAIYNPTWERDTNSTKPVSGKNYTIYAYLSGAFKYLTVRNGDIALAGNVNNACVFFLGTAQDGKFSISTMINGVNYYLTTADDKVVISRESDENWSFADNSDRPGLINGERYLTVDFDSDTCTMGGSSQALRYRENTTKDTSGNVPTYLPLEVTGGAVPETNTGYIVGGTSAGEKSGTQYNTGDTTVNEYPYSYIKTAFEKLMNGTETDAIAFPQGSVDQAAGSKYQAAKASFVKTIKPDENSDPTTVHAIRFIGGVVDKYVEAENVSILGQHYATYQFPESCVDFHVNSKGYASFFAAGLTSGNKSFFALYQIDRNAGEGTINAVRRIKKIYSYEGEYLYLTDAGNTYYGATQNYDGCPAGAVEVFDSSNLSDQKSSYWDNNTQGISKFYYFEVPLNAGEYALGAVANGAALLYLEVGGDDSGSEPGGEISIKRTRTNEVITITERKTTVPVGVDFVDAPVSLTPPLVTKASVSRALNASGEYTFARSNGKITCNGVEVTEKAEEITTIRRIVTLDYDFTSDYAGTVLTDQYPRSVRIICDQDGENYTFKYQEKIGTGAWTETTRDVLDNNAYVGNAEVPLPTEEEIKALQAEGETVLEYTYTAADAVIDSVFVPTVTAETDGTVAVTGGSYTVTSNKALGENVTKRKDGYTVTYNTTAP